MTDEKLAVAEERWREADADRERVKGFDIKLTVFDLAAILGLKPQTIRRGGAGTGEIPREYYGNEIRFDRRDVEAWLEGKRNAARSRLRSIKRVRLEGSQKHRGRVKTV